jgi:hypothetical protein
MQISGSRWAGGLDDGVIYRHHASRDDGSCGASQSQSSKGNAVFTTLALILAEIEFAPLDARVLTHTVRAV